MGKKFTANQNYREKPPLKLKPGDILIFKRNANSWTSKVLSWALQLLESGWDRWGWHTGYVSKVLPDGTIIAAEALIRKGVKTIMYPDLDSLGNVRVYRWLDEPNMYALEVFTEEHVECPYDLVCYFWTILQRILLQFSNHLIPRKLNDKYTCWELVCAMARAMGKPLQPVSRYPLITDMERTLESSRIL
jgi:hypothetical protein